VGNNTIPIIYFFPGSDLKRIDSSTTQQIDIQPSVLDYINYPANYFSFGKSVFDTLSNPYAFMYNSGVYQLVEGNYALEFNGEKATELYNFHSDSLLKQNLILKNPEQAKKMERKAKAIIQMYQQSMLKNKMVIN
jgi:hypothetical protein